MTPSTKRDDSAYQVPAVGKAVAILDALRAGGELTITEVVERSGVTKSTAYYLLQTLAAHGLIEQADRRFRLGLRLLDLAAGVARQVGPVDIIKRHLAALQAEFDATFVIYRRADAGHVILVDSVPREHGIHITVPRGSTFPIQGGSFGRCFLAYDQDAEVGRLLRTGLTRYTAHSVLDAEVFRREIARTREQGWAVDREGFALGVTTVAAPVVEDGDRVEFVVSAVAFASTMTATRVRAYGARLATACAEITSLLSGARAALAG